MYEMLFNTVKCPQSLDPVHTSGKMDVTNKSGNIHCKSKIMFYVSIQ